MLSINIAFLSALSAVYAAAVTNMLLA